MRNGGSRVRGGRRMEGREGGGATRASPPSSRVVCGSCSGYDFHDVQVHSRRLSGRLTRGPPGRPGVRRVDVSAG